MIKQCEVLIQKPKPLGGPRQCEWDHDLFEVNKRREEIKLCREEECFLSATSKNRLLIDTIWKRQPKTVMVTSSLLESTSGRAITV
jgi:hypothetical protein